MTEAGQLRRSRFESLYVEHRSAIFAYAVRRGATSPDDLVSQTFTTCWQRLEVVPTPALPWLYATARRHLANEWRRREHQQRVVDRVASTLVNSSEATTLSDAVAAAVDRDLARAMARLSDADRELLMLWGWEGLSGADLAVAAGCSPATVRVRLHRARRRLQALLPDTLAATKPHRPSTITPTTAAETSCDL